MFLRRRTLLYAALALAVPLQAFALSGGGAPSTSLNATASLSGCGIASSSIVCQIDVSWSPVDGATSYLASVTSPDGSVVDYGSVSGTSTSVYVPYVGNGTYSVSVSAYGTPPGADEPEVVAKDTADAGGSSRPSGSAANDAPAASAGVTAAPPTETGADSGTDAAGGTDETTDPGCTEETTPAPEQTEQTAPTEPTAPSSGETATTTTTTTTPETQPPPDPCGDAAAPGSAAPSG